MGRFWYGVVTKLIQVLGMTIHHDLRTLLVSVSGPKVKGQDYIKKKKSKFRCCKAATVSYILTCVLQAWYEQHHDGRIVRCPRGLRHCQLRTVICITDLYSIH